MVLFPCVKRFIRKYAQYLRCFPLIPPLSGQTQFSLPSRSVPAVISVRTFLICSSSTPCQSLVRSASIPHLKKCMPEKDDLLLRRTHSAASASQCFLASGRKAEVPKRALCLIFLYSILRNARYPFTASYTSALLDTS